MDTPPGGCGQDLEIDDNLAPREFVGERFDE
jgi:hypothetical protein